MERVAHYYTLLKNGETELIASRYQDVLYRKEGFYPTQIKTEVSAPASVELSHPEL